MLSLIKRLFGARKSRPSFNSPTGFDPFPGRPGTIVELPKGAQITAVRVYAERRAPSPTLRPVSRPAPTPAPRRASSDDDSFFGLGASAWSAPSDPPASDPSPSSDYSSGGGGDYSGGGASGDY